MVSNAGIKTNCVLGTTGKNDNVELDVCVECTVLVIEVSCDFDSVGACVCLRGRADREGRWFQTTVKDNESREVFFDSIYPFGRVRERVATTR